MRLFVSIIVVVTVGLAWLAIWASVLHVLGITVFSRKTEDRATRQERKKQLGKLRYILIFGVLGSGLAFGLGITAADVLRHDSHDWVSTIAKLVFLSVLFGWFQGARTWNEAFRNPVPFPPNYPPQK